MALTCYGGSTHERVLGELRRPYMLAYNLFAFVDCAYFLVVWSSVKLRKKLKCNYSVTLTIEPI
jgi:hypothetical protein